MIAAWNNFWFGTFRFKISFAEGGGETSAVHNITRNNCNCNMKENFNLKKT